MCRVLAYLGDPISLEHVLFETDSSLVRQSYSPRMMAAFLNLAGFGMVAWDPRSVHAEDPFTYRVTTLPAFDRNLHALAAKLAPTCLVAHVRGITYSAPRDDRGGEPAPVPLPRRERRAGAQRPPARVRAHALRPHQPRPARARAARSRGRRTPSGSTRSCSRSSRIPTAYPEPRELADAAVVRAAVLREVRGRHGIDTSSPVNLCLTTGHALVATRFSFDYGWYPDEDVLLETDLPYVSLWYTRRRRVRASATASRR